MSLKSYKLWQIKEVSAEKFLADFIKIRENYPRPDTVLVRDLSIYQACRVCYIMYDDYNPVAAVAVTKDAEIISLIGNPNYSGATKYLITAAVVAGGRKLDCYGVKNLWFAYHHRGFVPCAKIEIDRPAWWKDEDGERYYIYYWYLNPEIGLPSAYKWDGSKEDIEDFGIATDENKSKAETYRDQIVTDLFKDKDVDYFNNTDKIEEVQSKAKGYFERLLKAKKGENKMEG